MASSGYTPWSVTAGEIPTTAYWNILGSNDASFNTGTGINDGAILTRHLAANNVTKITYVYNEVFANTNGFTSSGFNSFSGWTAGTFTSTGGDILLHIHFTYWKATTGPINNFRVQLNGSTNYPSNTGFQQYTNEFSSHKMCSRTLWLTSIPAGTYTVALQGNNASATGSLNTDSADALNIVAVEYLK